MNIILEITVGFSTHSEEDVSSLISTMLLVQICYFSSLFYHLLSNFFIRALFLTLNVINDSDVTTKIFGANSLLFIFITN